ncbi:MAG: prephenate dehydrogenase [Thermodesulfovibrionales bacterium]
MRFRRVTIIGVGMIGASLALAMKKRGLADEIIGVGRSEKNLRLALARKVIDSFTMDAAEACRDAGLVVLATPVGAFQKIVSAIGSSLTRGTIVTDVGSVKGSLVTSLEMSMPDGISFVGSHPIAGSDRSGCEAATPDLFEGALCVVTPTNRTDSASLFTIKSLWQEIGSRVTELDPAEHDRIFSAVSHLPHVVAYALVSTVGRIGTECMQFSGQGLRDSTRIALSLPELWVDICRYNATNISDHLEVLLREIETVRCLVQERRFEELRGYFELSKQLRESLG